jgi:hypothetical protein
MYRLDNKFANSGHFSVTVVGCGGTGGFAAEGLCRLLPKEANLMLVDHDRVEERNLTRQCFTKEELGEFKSEALAKRLSREFGRPVAYSTLPVSMTEVKLPGLVIGCVDNGLARADIAEATKSGLCPSYGHSSWWVDAGNGENYGQVLIGNTDIHSSPLPDGDIYHALPLPIIQRPDLLRQVPRARDCASIAEDQGPTINLSMAAIVVEVVRRIIAGTCPWVQLYLDMEAGTLIPVLATPETVKYLSKRKGGSHGRTKR